MPAVHERGGGPRLRLSPFRGLRFGLDGPPLASVLCPPYDVVEPQRRAQLVARDAHNVVRLTLPQARNPAAAAATLQRWLSAGVLHTDRRPGLYVLDQSCRGRRWRGVVGAVDLDGPVLPHEDVMPHVVKEREALLAELQTDLEPLLLTVEGGVGHVLTDVVATASRVARTSLNGIELTLWRVVDPSAQAHVAAAAADRVALIADGHHRWTAAQQHAARLRERHGRGPWDRCLALVVDSQSDPLQLSSIHRVIEGVDVERARRMWEPEGCWEQAPLTAADLAGAVIARAPGAIGVTDGRSGWLLRPASGDPVRLDVEWLHETLLPRLGVPESAVSYHHDAEDAVAAAGAASGVAVLCAPVPLATVRERARAERRMPRKATSFGPKPPSGLVMRRHRDG